MSSRIYRGLWRFTIVEVRLALGLLIGLAVFAVGGMAWATNILGTTTNPSLLLIGGLGVTFTFIILIADAFVLLIVIVSSLIFGQPNPHLSRFLANQTIRLDQQAALPQVVATKYSPWQPDVIDYEEFAYAQNGDKSS